MSKESDKIAEALENIAITFDELGFSPTIPIPKGDKAHFIDWFKFEVDDIKAVSTQQAQRIAELEEQLANSISPKFKPHEDLFVIIDYRDGTKGIEKYYIDEIIIRGNGKYIEYRDIGQKMVIGEDNLLFASYEEALAKLEELKGE